MIAVGEGFEARPTHPNGVHHLATPPNAVVPFLVGTAVGGVAGAVVGTLLSEHTVHLIAAIVDVVDRRLHAEERERLKFELLLQ